MFIQDSTARNIWRGNLVQGGGTLTVGSGAFGPLTTTFAARTEGANGKTSPEELIAAAHATCFAMAFSSGLNKEGKPPTELEVNATCSLERVDNALTITKMQLDVKGIVPGLDAAGFDRLAQEAGQNCPVSRALKGSVQVTVKTELKR